MNKWSTITSDNIILNIVSGYKIEFSELPIQYNFRETKLCFKEAIVLDNELEKLLKKGVVEVATHSEGEFISTIFLRPKKTGGYRMILNLTELNKFIVYKHFKMERLESACRLMTKNCFMASIDLKDAYYSVNICNEHRKYLRFIWRGQLFQFTACPNGLASAPRLFTKLLKPAYSHLRSQGLVSVAYIDDCYLQGLSYEDCLANVEITKQFFSDLGFIVHNEKSVFIPSQEVTFLGFLLNSVTMTISLTPEKVTHFLESEDKFRKGVHITIREVAKFVGTLIAYSVAIPLGLLYTRILEREKIDALRLNKWNFYAKMMLSNECFEDINWWKKHLHLSVPVQREPPTVTITTDASFTGWGVEFKEHSTGGHWSVAELDEANSINFLELQAIYLGILCFLRYLCHKHIKILCDNATAVAYLNNFGGTKSMKCNSKARDIWELAVSNRIWITAVHLPGVENLTADRESRKIRDETEWSLNDSLFNKIQSLRVDLDIDLFASRLNYKISKFVSWKADPLAWAIDAFTLQWKNFIFYAFPPFSLIDRVCQKVLVDEAEGILVVPYWPAQSWFPLVLKLCVNPPWIIKPGKRILILQNKPETLHPLHKNLHLLVCHVSGLHYNKEIYQKEQFRLL